MKPASRERITFADVAGQATAKAELREVVEFLANPARFSVLGARVPRGVLLVGDPGNGKTLLAKAVAGEARVPFYHIAGSELLEVFAGLGAARVRRTFALVRGMRLKDRFRNAGGGILFIDEVDAIGGKRGRGFGGGAQQEREQILNQFLVEMDGMTSNRTRRGRPVVVICATNRPDTLDPALTRAGRLDRTIAVAAPDRTGRQEILSLHVRKTPLAGDVNLGVLASVTPGFSGADLANLVNEAAIIATRERLRSVPMRSFLAARERVILGNPRPGTLMSDGQRRIVATHEAGHAIVGLRVADADKPLKASLVPHGQSLGHVMSLPTEDEFVVSRRRLVARIVVLLGGRAAEEVIFGEDMVTTGAADDFGKALTLVTEMAGRFGMVPEVRYVGALRNAGEMQTMFGGTASAPRLSEAALQQFDAAVKAEFDACWHRAVEIVRQDERAVRRLADELLAKETVGRRAMLSILNASTGNVETPDEGGQTQLAAFHAREESGNQHSDGPR